MLHEGKGKGSPGWNTLHTVHTTAGLSPGSGGAKVTDFFGFSAGFSGSSAGFAGLALQAGARSAIGTLWYVDDVVTSAFFVQFYRFLSQMSLYECARLSDRTHL